MRIRVCHCIAVLALLALSACATKNRHGAETLIDARSKAFDSLTSRQVAGRSALQWYVDLYEWWGHKDPAAEVVEVVRTVGDGYLPLAVECLSKDGVILHGGTRQKAKDELEQNRVRALAVFVILRDKAAPSIPSLVKLLEDRTWKERLMVANALALMGSVASTTMPMAMADLTSERTEIRRQGLIILGGVGGHSDEAVQTLIRYTASDSDLLQNTAVWGLKQIMETKDAQPDLARSARSHLEALAKGRGAGHVHTSARFALGLDP